MKRLIFMALAIIPVLSFSQEFTRADKEELVYQSLKQLNLSKRWKTIYVIVNPADTVLGEFIRQKFPRIKWHLYPDDHLSESLMETDKESMMLALNMWGRNDYWRAGFQAIWISKTYHPYNLQVSGICGDDLTGSMIYDPCSGRWKFCTAEEFRAQRQSGSSATSL